MTTKDIEKRLDDIEKKLDYITEALDLVVPKALVLETAMRMALDGMRAEK